LKINKGLFNYIGLNSISLIIPIITTPIIANLYGSEVYGKYSVSLALLSLLSILSTGKFENALSIPKSNREASNILKIGLIYLALFSLFLSITLVFLSFVNLHKYNYLKSVFILLPFMIFINGCNNIFQFFRNRKRDFNKISFSNITNTFSQAFLNISFYYSFGSSFILLILNSFLSSSLKLTFLFSKKEVSIITTNFIQGIRETFIKYKDFIFKLTPSSFLNTLSSSSLLLLFSYFYDIKTTATIAIIMRIGSLPTNLITKSLGDYFRQDISDGFQEKKLIEFYKKLIRKIFVFTLLPFILLYINIDLLSSLVFNNEWNNLGVFLKILAFSFYFKFLFSALPSIIIQISKKLKIDMYWQISLMITSSLSIYLGYKIFNDPKFSVFFYSVTYISHYLISYLISIKIIKQNENNISFN